MCRLLILLLLFLCVFCLYLSLSLSAYVSASPVLDVNDDLSLSPEQEGLLFVEEWTKKTTHDGDDDEEQIDHKAVDGGVEHATDKHHRIPTHREGQPLHSTHNDTSDTASLPDSVDAFSSDLGGVIRLLSSLFSPSLGIRHPGHWSLVLHIPYKQYQNLSQLLQHKQGRDIEEMIEIGTTLFQQAEYYPIEVLTESNTDSTTTISLLDNPWAVFHSYVYPHLLRQTSFINMVIHLVLISIGTAIGIAIGRRTARTASHSSTTTATTTTHATTSQLTAARARSLGAHRRHVSSFISPRDLGIGLLLFGLVLFIYGYVHHYHELRNELRAKIRVLMNNPPAGCYPDESSPWYYSWFTDLKHSLTTSSKDSTCWKYEASLAQSPYPNPWFVLTDYLSSTVVLPLEHLGNGLGAFMRAFLSHHPVVAQVMMMVFLVIFLWGMFWLFPHCCLRLLTARAVRRHRIQQREQQVVIEDVSVSSEEEEHHRQRGRRRLRQHDDNPEGERDADRRQRERQRLLLQNQHRDNDEEEEESAEPEQQTAQDQKERGQQEQQHHSQTRLSPNRSPGTSAKARIENHNHINNHRHANTADLSPATPTTTISVKQETLSAASSSPSVTPEPSTPSMTIVPVKREEQPAATTVKQEQPSVVKREQPAATTVKQEQPSVVKQQQAVNVSTVPDDKISFSKQNPLFDATASFTGVLDDADEESPVNVVRFQ